MKGRGRAADLSEMLAACGFDQTIESVVRVISIGLHALVAKVDGLLSVIVDMSDVACRIVSVVKVLHLASGPTRRRRLRTIIGKVSGLACVLRDESGER